MTCWVVADVESDGGAPGLYSMISFGLVKLDRDLKTTFYAECCPISDHFVPSALAVSGKTREQHLVMPDPKIAMEAMAEWLHREVPSRPVFVSDNPAFDFAFINYYAIKYLGRNPFGWSARRIGDMYAGLTKDPQKPWKHLRKTRHSHHPVDDATGNAEALLEMGKMGLRLPI